MTTYMTWPVDIDAAFRTRYLAVTGEAIQDNPATDGDRFMVGSSRVSLAMRYILEADFPGVVFSADMPDGFTPEFSEDS